MKHTFIYILFFLSSVSCALGQNTDSLSISSRSKIYSGDSVKFSAYDFAKTSPFFIKKLMPQQYSSINAGYNYSKGTLMHAQDASKLYETFLSTEGITQIKTVSLWGQFVINKTVEDSTKFAHITRYNPTNRYYFGSPIDLNYERTVYNLKALASKNMLKNNLPIGLGADYRIGNHYSTNDPRGDIKDFQFDLTATAGYNLSKQLSVGAGYRYGYGRERVNVGYKNNSLSQGSVKPEYNTYLINGYGEAQEYNTNRSINTDFKRNGLEINLAAEKTTFGDVYFNYRYTKEKQEFYYRSDGGYFNYVDYNNIAQNFRLLWLKGIALNTLSIDLQYNNNDGDNYIIEYLSNSYIFNSNTISAKATYSIHQKKAIHNYSICIQKIGEQRQDGLAGNDIQFNQLNFSIGYGLNKQTTQQHNWGFSVMAHYNKYLNSHFNTTANNVGVFTRNVIYYDYAYNTTSKFGANLTGDYSIPMFKQIQAGIKVGLNYWRRDDLKDFGRVLTSAPGKDRFSSNISLNLYF